MAKFRASASVPASAAPQGLLCLITTAAGSLKSRTMARALSRSKKLLYESSLPLSCRAATTLAPVSPRHGRGAGGEGSRIDRRLLMRVLAVAQHLLPLETQMQRAGEA